MIVNENGFGITSIPGLGSDAGTVEQDSSGSTRHTQHATQVDQQQQQWPSRPEVLKPALAGERFMYIHALSSLRWTARGLQAGASPTRGRRCLRSAGGAKWFSTGMNAGGWGKGNGSRMAALNPYVRPWSMLNYGLLLREVIWVRVGEGETAGYCLMQAILENLHENESDGHWRTLLLSKIVNVFRIDICE